MWMHWQLPAVWHRLLEQICSFCSVSGQYILGCWYIDQYAGFVLEKLPLVQRGIFWLRQPLCYPLKLVKFTFAHQISSFLLHNFGMSQILFFCIGMQYMSKVPACCC